MSQETNNMFSLIFNLGFADFSYFRVKKAPKVSSRNDSTILVCPVCTDEVNLFDIFSFQRNFAEISSK